MSEQTSGMPTTGEILSYAANVDNASDMGILKSKDNNKPDKPEKQFNNQGQGKGAVHLTTPEGNKVLVNPNKVMVKTPDGRIIQVKDNKTGIQVSGKGSKRFNDGSLGNAPNPIPNPNSLVAEIIAFVNNLLKIFDREGGS